MYKRQVENFTHYALGRTFSLPGFFGRGTKSIEQQSPQDLASPSVFSFIQHPRGPSAVADGSPSFATIDAEPWVIPSAAAHPGLAEVFLEFFYREENYLEYTTSVPIHLTPIFRDLAENSAYSRNSHVQKWQAYHEELLKRLDAGTVRPIFMSSGNDRLRPALFRLEGTHVVPEMIRGVFAGKDIAEAIAAGNERAAAMTRGLALSVEGESRDPGQSSTRAKASNSGAIVVLVLLLAGAGVLAFFMVRRRL